MPLFLPVTTGPANHPLLVWGDVRPAPDAARQTHKRQQVQVQFKGSGGSYKTLQTVPLTDPRGYFEIRPVFPSGGSVRLRWTYPDGTTVYSRTVNITLQ
jgi:hypothetical protein